MSSNETEALATRLPVAEAARFNLAIEQTGYNQAELVRRAIRYYAYKNPDRIEVLDSNDSIMDPLRGLDGIPPLEPVD